MTQRDEGMNNEEIADRLTAMAKGRSGLRQKRGWQAITLLLHTANRRV